MKSTVNNLIKRTFKGKFPSIRTRLINNNKIILSSNRIVRINKLNDYKRIETLPNSSKILTKRGNYKMGNGKSKYWKTVKEFGINRGIYSIRLDQKVNNNLKLILEREIYNNYLYNKLYKIYKKHSYLK